MSESSLSPKADFWRKVILGCALGCLSTTFINDTSSFGGWWVLAWEWLFISRMEAVGYILTGDNEVGLFIRACGTLLFQVGFFTSVFLLVLFGKRFTAQTKPPIAVRLLSFLFFGLSFSIPVWKIYSWTRSMQRIVSHTIQEDLFNACRAFFVVMLILLFLLCGLFILLARDHRGTRAELPILSTPPAFMQFVYWCCAFIYLLWIPGSPFSLSILFAVLCAGGTLVALVQYIRAIKASDSPLRHS
jgi:hypothetical protein